MKIYNDEAIDPTRMRYRAGHKDRILPFSAKQSCNAFSCDFRLSHTALSSGGRVMMVNKYWASLLAR